MGQDSFFELPSPSQLYSLHPIPSSYTSSSPLYSSSSSSSFVLPDTSRKSRQKTRVLKRTDCPVFNHTMVYDGFQPEDLREACVELTVWDRDRLANHLLGGLRLGMGTGRAEA